MDFYVYLHRKKTTGEVFYVGKGSTSRAWSKEGRNELWKRIVNKHDYTVEIYLDNLQEWYAFELEQDLISLYGTIVDKSGPLSNMTGGGEGLGGVNHARYDRSEWTFYNYKTKETIRSTKMYFGNKFPDVHVGSLFHRELSSKGWSTKEVYDSVDHSFLLNCNAGIHNGRSDNSVYNFTNLVTGEIFKGTRWNFKDQFGFNPRDLFTERVNYVVKHWCLTENEEIAREMSGKDHKVYTFYHKDGRIFTGTRVAFKNTHGYSIKPLFATKALKTCKGWSLAPPN